MMKSNSFRVMSIFLSVIMVLNVGIFGLSFGDTKEMYNVGNMVWYDKNGNGLYDDGGYSSVVKNVKVSIYDSNSQFVASTTTGPTGGYNFHVPKGVYTIKFDESSFPEGYYETKRDMGNNDNLDSDGVKVEVVVYKDKDHIDLGLTNKPYKVRVTQRQDLYDFDLNVLGTLYRNTIKTVYGHHDAGFYGEFYKVWYDDKWAYLNRRSTDYNMIKQLEYDIKARAYIGLEVFKYPDHLRIGWLPQGTVKTVYGKALSSDNFLFYRIWYKGGPGYVLGLSTTRLDYNVRITDKTVVREHPKGPALPGYLYKNKIKSAYGYKTDINGVMWYRVWHNGGPGYVYKLVTSRNLTSVPDFNVKLNYKLTVRSSVWGTTLGTIPKNTVKTVYGERFDRDGETWYRVWYNGGPGYIRAKYTTKQ